MEAIVLPSVKFSPSSFIRRQISTEMNFYCGRSPLQHSALPKICIRASDRFSPCAALLRSDSFGSRQDVSVPEEEQELEVAIDPGIFEEIFPTLQKQEGKPRRKRSSKSILGESTSQSILIPDEWVPVQKHHLRTKKERKQEVRDLQIQRAREREVEERAVQQQAAREAQARLYRSVYFCPVDVNGNSSTTEREGAEGLSNSDAADDGWNQAEMEDFLVELEETESAADNVSGRARPKDYRAGLEFSSLEQVAERLREVVEAGTNSSGKSDPESGDKVEDEYPEIVVELTTEEKAMLRNRNLNFAAISSKSWSPLHTLAAAGQVYLAAELIKRGALVDALDKEGLTPIHRAIQSGRKTMVRLLLKAGANTQVRDKDGATLLHYAAQTGNHDIAKLLLRDDVDVNAADKDGWTALHVAVQSGRTEMIRCLINRGADMKQANNEGNSPYDLSLSFGNCFKFYDTIKFMKRKEVEFRRRRKSRDSEDNP